MSNLEAGQGVVAAVCMSPAHGFPTYPQESVFIDTLGIPGDAHAGPRRASFRQPGTYKPNDRPISIVSSEVLQEMNEQFGLALEPGSFNEQILVRGMGDLGQVAVGARVQFGTGVRLEVVDRAWPCQTLADYHNEQGLVKALATVVDGQRYSRRGLLARVLETGYLTPGTPVWIDPARQQA